MASSEINEVVPAAVGTLVVTRIPFDANRVGTPGLVYHTQLDGDVYFVSILLNNGHDIGAFNEVEIDTCFEVLKTQPFTYTYQDPSQLQADFKNGLFDSVFATL